MEKTQVQLKDFRKHIKSLGNYKVKTKTTDFGGFGMGSARFWHIEKDGRFLYGSGANVYTPETFQDPAVQYARDKTVYDGEEKILP